MAELFNPTCGIPKFQLENIEDAEHCGNLNGRIVAGLVSIPIVIGFVMWYNSEKNKKVLNPKTKKMERASDPWWIWIVMAISLVLIWLFIPKLFGFFATRNFQTSKLQREILLRHGYTEKDAYNSQQQLYQTGMQSNATLMAGQAVAGAINRNNYY